MMRAFAYTYNMIKKYNKEQIKAIKEASLKLQKKAISSGELRRIKETTSDTVKSVSFAKTLLASWNV